MSILDWSAPPSCRFSQWESVESKYWARTDPPSGRDDLRKYVDAVRADLVSVIHGEELRFPSGTRLIDRFEEAVSRLFDHGWNHLEEVQEIHNELCTAVLILEDDAESRCASLEYEPALPDCAKRFDFRADFSTRSSSWLEVKTIHPRPLDAWERYERAVEGGHFSNNARLVLDQSWMGGELYHKYFSARAKLLHYAVECEVKIEECLSEERGPVFLVLFSNGFDWHVEDLEDFLHFYRYGRHFQGDHFRVMEQHHIERKSIELRRTIDHFSYVERSSSAVRPAGAAWSVKAVRFSPSRGFY